ncbi:MAG: PKD domain-containing protein [Planctomycetota bacterium]|jgi:murein DD-endopeptidase MepM/ murein hydrolase activator NlpD
MKICNFTRRNFLKNTGLSAAALIIGSCDKNMVDKDMISTNISIPEIPFETIDINIGKKNNLVLYDGTKVSVELLSIDDELDSICSAVRQSKINLLLNSKKVLVFSCNYHLPVKFGDVKLDCPITKSYYQTTKGDRWGLVKDARIRFWPAESPLLPPGTFECPIKQKWFANGTQMANEPVYICGNNGIKNKKIYYHSGLDLGGIGKMVEIVAATDGLLVEVGLDALDGYELSPLYRDPRKPRKDVVYIKDKRGWLYRHSHLSYINKSLKVGNKIKKGQKIGIMGNEGEAGWSHLHFEIECRQSSGEWGTQAAYPFVWEAYINEFKPDLIAVAKPHKAALLSEPVTLDGSKSWAIDKGKLKFEWLLSDGTCCKKAKPVKTYDRAGAYSEILKVSDSKGNFDYDFCTVQIFDPQRPKLKVPSIHANYYPTMNLKVGQQITFSVQSFSGKRIGETLDFGDGTRPAKLTSDGAVNILLPGGYALTTHRYKKPGDYLVTAECKDQNGYIATCHLHIRIEP